MLPSPAITFPPARFCPTAVLVGCWWNRCSFCPEKAEGVRYDPVPPKEAVLEAGELCAAHRPALIHFVDSAMSPALLSRLSENPPGRARGTVSSG